MDILDEIYTALSDPIKTAVIAGTLPKVNWDNEGFNVVEGVAYLEVQNFPQDINPDEIGSSAPSRFDGFFQVNVKTPSGIGTKMATGYVTWLLATYKKGTPFTTASGLIVRVRKTVPAGGLNDKDWYMVPVTVYYYTFV